MPKPKHPSESGEPLLIPIGEAARRLGVSADTLRRWEESGHLHPVRTLGGQRRYSAALIDAMAGRRSA